MCGVLSLRCCFFSLLLSAGLYLLPFILHWLDHNPTFASEHRALANDLHEFERERARQVATNLVDAANGE